MNDPKTILADQIINTLADQGKIVEGGWQAFKILRIPATAPERQKEEMRKAFFLGAQHLFAAVTGMLDPGTEPTEKDMRRMELIYKELKDFVDEVTKGKGTL